MDRSSKQGISNLPHESYAYSEAKNRSSLKVIISLFCLPPSNGVWVAAGWGWLVRFLAAGCGLNKMPDGGLGVAGTLPRRWLRVKQNA